MKNMSAFLDYMMDDETATGALKTLQESTKSRAGSSNLFFRFKRMEYGSACTLRFLPISEDVAENEACPKFTLPKKVIRLRFENPQQEGSEVVLTIPVMQMFRGGRTEDDLILKQVKALYDEADKLLKAGKEERAAEIRSTASYHWMRGECLAQGFVIRPGLTENDPPENLIRLFELNKQVMNIIQSTVNSDDPETRLEYWPVHGKKGSNFIIKKTKSGEWPSYTSSSFSRQTTPWTSEQVDAINNYGLWRLDDFLPARPSDEEYGMLAQIVERSIAGNRVWDPDYEQHLKTVKVFKTNQSSSSDDEDPEAIQARVRETVAHVGSGMSSTSDILNLMNRTARKSDDDEPTTDPVTQSSTTGGGGDDEELETSEDAPANVQNTRTILDKIKRGATKTATA